MKIHNINSNDVDNLAIGYMEMGELNKEIANENNDDINDYENFLNSNDCINLQNAYANFKM